MTLVTCHLAIGAPRSTAGEPAGRGELAGRRQARCPWPVGLRLVVLALTLAIGASTAGCSRPRDAPGGSLPRAGVPRRIVSLVPAVTEMLFAIGAGGRVVAVSSFDTWPVEVRSLEKVGALLDPDVERIIRLRADLVVVYGSQAELRSQLAAAGIATFPYVLGGLDNVTATMRRLGAVAGAVSEAEAAAAGVEARLEAIRRRVAGRPRPRTLLVFGHEAGALRAIDASGGVGFLNDIVRLAGGENVFGSERRELLRVSTESILTAAPEVVIDIHYGVSLPPGGPDRERAVWKALAAVPAVRDGRVAVLVGDQFVVPGPRVVETAGAIADAIAPPRSR